MLARVGSCFSSNGDTWRPIERAVEEAVNLALVMSNALWCAYAMIAAPDSGRQPLMLC